MSARTRTAATTRTQRTPRSGTPSRPGGVVGWAVYDAAAVVLFAALGRNAHGESLSLGGLAHTAWPFLLAAALGWLICRAWRAPGAIVPTGLVIWAVTVAGGMLLRVVSGQGTHWSFILVTAAVTALLLLGMRAVVNIVTRRR